MVTHVIAMLRYILLFFYRWYFIDNLFDILNISLACSSDIVQGCRQLSSMLSLANCLTCYVQAKNIDDAFNSCNEVLAAEPDNIDALCDRAETYINNEQYEEGIALHSDYNLLYCSFTNLELCCYMFGLT